MEKPGESGQVRQTVSTVSMGVTTERGDRHGALVCTQRGDRHGPLSQDEQRGDLNGPLSQITTRGDRHGALKCTQRGGRYGILTQMHTRGDLYGPPTQEDGSRSLPHKISKRTASIYCISLLLWFILVFQANTNRLYHGVTRCNDTNRVDLGHTDSANDGRDFIFIRSQGRERLGAAHKPTNKNIQQFPCAQPEEVLPSQTYCRHQGGRHKPDHLHHPGSDVTIATRTMSTGFAGHALPVVRNVPTTSLETTNGKGMGYSNNHTTFNCEIGKNKTPPPPTLITSYDDTSSVEIKYPWADAVHKFTSFNQRALRDAWHTSWIEPASSLDQYTWMDPEQYKFNTYSKNTNFTICTHQIMVHANIFGTRNKAPEAVPTQALEGFRNAQLSKREFHK